MSETNGDTASQKAEADLLEYLKERRRESRRAIPPERSNTFSRRASLGTQRLSSEVEDETQSPLGNAPRRWGRLRVEQPEPPAVSVGDVQDPDRIKTWLDHSAGRDDWDSADQEAVPGDPVQQTDQLEAGGSSSYYGTENPPTEQEERLDVEDLQISEGEDFKPSRTELFVKEEDLVSQPPESSRADHRRRRRLERRRAAGLGSSAEGPITGVDMFD
ncbi:hypothetical protein ACHAPT_010458 [Fusarium lateritium]